MRLAAALNEQGLVANASMKAKQWIVDQLRAADTQQREEVDAKVEDIQTLAVATLTLGMGAQLTTTSETVEAATAEGDLDSYFVRAQRVLPDGSASWYFNDLCDRGVDEIEAGVRLAAMAALGFKEIIERQAVEQIKAWRDAHASALARKPRNVRDQIEPLWYLGSSPMHPTTVEARQTYPAATEKIVGDGTRPVPMFSKHLYVIPHGKPNAGLFPVDTSRSTWEADVLEKELGAETLVGWYRNPNSGRHALAVPYEFGDKTLLMHPDFLFFHQDGDEIVWM
jgi:type III restriction enzyme